MIIDIRKLLNKLTKKKDDPNDYSFSMEFDGMSFSPALKRNTTTPKITVQAKLPNGAEFVGFGIVMTAGDGISILATNGLFITSQETRANTVLIFPSFAEAIEACNQLPHYITRANNVSQQYAVWACYQVGTRNTLEFRKVNV